MANPNGPQDSRSLADFAKTVRESFRVTDEVDSDGRRTLLHIVRPSRGHEQGGIRDTRYGPRIVPPAKDVDDICGWVRYLLQSQCHNVYCTIRLQYVA